MKLRISRKRGRKNMHEMHWEYDPETRQFYYREDTKKYRVKALLIYANGIRDSCIRLGDDGEPKIAKIANTPKEKILSIPDGDVAIVMLDRLDKPWLLFDVNPSTKPMIDFMLNNVPRLLTGNGKGEDFEMYGGDNYDFWGNRNTGSKII